MNNKIDILISAGFKKTDAKVLLYMFSHPISVSRDIEREMIMRQPEVSNTMKRFKTRGWITTSKTRTIGKRGRPETLFTLSKSKEEIFSEIKNQIEHKMLSIQEVLIQFKKLEEI